jgi:hypothetical protein
MVCLGVNRISMVGTIILIGLDAFVGITWVRDGLGVLTTSPRHYLLVSVFVGIVEIWVWIERAKMAGHLSLVDDVADRYWLIPRISVAEMNQSRHLARLARHVVRRRKNHR